MRWYSNNFSLIVKGKNAEEMNTQLRIIANLANKETELSDTIVSEENSEKEGDCINTDNSSQKSQLVVSPHETVNYDKVLDSIQDLEMRFVNKFDELLQEIRLSKTTNETMREDRNSLIRENTKLRQEIGILSEQVNNYKYTTSDLNTRIKQLEDEQKSLITAIRIVQNDQITNKESSGSWNVVKNLKPNQNDNIHHKQNSGENCHNDLAKAN